MREVADTSTTELAYMNLPNGAGSEYGRALDGRLHVTFHKLAVYNPRMSEGWEEYIDDMAMAQGVRRIKHPPYDVGPNGEMIPGPPRPRFELKDYVRIIAPGDKDNIVDREVRPSDKARFRPQWQAYCDDKDQVAAIGTPLSMLLNHVPPVINEAQVEEYKAQGVRTCEQLISMSDANAQKFMGFNDVKRRVTVFLDTFKENRTKEELRVEFEKRDRANESLTAQVEELKRQLAELTAPRASPLTGPPIARKEASK